MSCQSCIQIPLDAHARFMQKTRRPKSIKNARIRVVYINPKTEMLLFIDDSIPITAIDSGSYFFMDAGPKYVSLQDRKGDVSTREEFIFDKDHTYTLIVREKEIYQLEDDLVCPESGTSRLQVYNLHAKSINVYIDDEVVFEDLKPQESFEIILDENLYEMRINPDLSLSSMIELELKSPIIYTVFLIPSTWFVVENPYCNNLV